MLAIKTDSVYPCLVQNSSSIFGTLSSSCFSVSVSSLYEIIIHTDTSNTTILGITFNFINDASASYMEKSEISINNSIKLNDSEIRGVAIGGRDSIDSLQFQIYSYVSQNITWTPKFGGNSSNSSFLNASSTNSAFLLITTIYACIDCNQSSSLPSLAFDYTYSPCLPVWNDWNSWTSCQLIRERNISFYF